MWTIIVEAHLPNGKGTLFQVGKWPSRTGAERFANKIEVGVGRAKIIAHVVYNGNTAYRLWEEISQGKVSVKQGLELPPCDTLDFDEEEIQ